MVRGVNIKIGKLSRDVGVIVSFTHNTQWDYLLPGIPPTGKKVELPHVVVMKFENGKVAHEHAQATQEVILSLGAIHTPKILMQSGIGDEMELRSAGITVLHALPGVGRNLHDHVAVGCVWENSGRWAPQIPRSQTSCFWKTRTALEAPNFYVYSHGKPDFTCENAARFNPPAACWSLSVGMRPNSRGVIHLTGSDPADPVSIDTNYLGDPQDLRISSPDWAWPAKSEILLHWSLLPGAK